MIYNKNLIIICFHYFYPSSSYYSFLAPSSSIKSSLIATKLSGLASFNFFALTTILSKTKGSIFV